MIEPIKRPDSLKWGKLKERYGREDLLAMWVADMDFAIAEPIQKAIEEVAKRRDFGYGYYPQELFEAVMGWHRRRFGVEVEKEWIIFVPGVLAGVDAANRAVAGETIIQPPVYPPFFRFGNVHNPLTSDFTIDYKDLETKDAKKLLLCSPHNPVGRVWSYDELEKVALIAKKKGWVVLSDEIHADITFKPHTPFWKFYEKSIAFYAPSKSFNLAGLAFAYAIVPDRALRAAFRRATRFLSTTPFGMAATIAAYNEGEAWLEELLVYIKRNRDYMLQNLNYEVAESEGTYLLWVKKRGEEFERRVVEKAKVAPSFGKDFGDENYFRLNIATDFAIIRQVTERLNEL